MGAVFPWRPREDIRSDGWLDTDALTMHSETAGRTQGPRATGPSEIYQRLLRRTRADLPESLSLGEASQSRMRRALTNWRAGCGKSARPVRREGWSSNLHPYPYYQVIPPG